MHSPLGAMCPWASCIYIRESTLAPCYNCYVHNISLYRILQIVQGGKVSRLQNSTVIRWKTFAVGLSFFYNLLSEGNYFAGKVSRLPTDPQKP